MSEARAPVAVVVVSWNSATYLSDCLNSLRRLERPPAEVVVVDGASADGSADLVRREFPECKLIACDENVGFCRGNNVGINACGSPFVLALNPDTRLQPDFLERQLPAFDDPAVGMTGGKLLRFDGRTLDSAGQQLGGSRQPIDRGYGRIDEGRFDEDADVFGICGAAALYRRAMLETISDPGPTYFDETFFAFGEDLDLAWRARRLGWRARYLYRAIGYHARGGSAARPTVARRAAMLSHTPTIRYHIAKNRYLTILRNDTLRAYLGHAPQIWSRDIATFLLLLTGSPSVLARLWRSRALFRDALRKGRLDGGRTGPQL